MDLENNDLKIENEDDLLKVDEENKDQQGNEVFRESEEHFLVDEENLKVDEENISESSKNKEGKVKNDTSNLSSSSSHSLGASLSLPTIVISTIASVTLIGTTAGIIPQINSTHVSNFLVRSTELGFSLDKDPNETFVMTLSNDDFNYSAELISTNQYVFQELRPDTVYFLTVYNTTNGEYKKIYQANYLTDAFDSYNAYIVESAIEGNNLVFNINYEGNDINFVTIQVLNENYESIYLYEGAPKEEFYIDVKDSKNVTCKVSVNGEITNLQQFEIDSNNDDIPIESISLSSNELNLGIGDTALLSASVLPENATNKDITWSSSDENVAYVDASGLVRALSSGVCQITASSSDNNVHAYCTITVSSEIVHVSSIYLDNFELNLNVDETIHLNASVYPENATNKEVTWSSSDENVAYVDNDGNITGISGGEATITATTVDGEYCAYCTVTVNATNIPVEGITLDKNELALETGSKGTLHATINPINAFDQYVTWESENEDIATVVDGVVTAVSAGSTTIKVTTRDGNYSDTCEVTITDPVVSVTNITLRPFYLTAYIGYEDSSLVATISPENATNQEVIWSSSDESIATVDENGVIKGISAGKVTITATSVDGGYEATCSVTVKSTDPTFSNFFIYKNVTNYGNTVITATISYEDPLKYWNDDFSVLITDYQGNSLYTVSLKPLEDYCAAIGGSGRFYVDGWNDEITELLLSNLSGDYKCILYPTQLGVEEKITTKSFTGFTNGYDPIPGSIIIDDNVVNEDTNEVNPSFHIATSNSLTSYQSINVTFTNVNTGQEVIVENITLDEVITLSDIILDSDSEEYVVRVEGDGACIIEETVSFTNN